MAGKHKTVSHVFTQLDFPAFMQEYSNISAIIGVISGSVRPSHLKCHQTHEASGAGDAQMADRGSDRRTHQS